LAYDFLGLTNKVLTRVNEVNLTTSTFDSASGFFAHAKDSVNNSIRDINQEQFEWPFNFTEHTETLVAGQVKYDYPSDVKRIDYESFRIQRDDSLNVETVRLKPITYDDYLKHYSDYEYNTDTSIRNTPVSVFKRNNRSYGIIPSPDEAYSLTFDYFNIPDDLDDATDVPSLPQSFEPVITDGAMYHVYMFRGNPEAAQVAQQKFLDGIKDLRKIHINKYEYVTDTRIIRPRSSRYLRIN